MDHTLHTPLTQAELTQAALEGATIYGPNNEKIGHVSEVHGAGATAQVIVDVGGFLGIGAKPVAISIEDLTFMRDEGSRVHAVTSWTKDEFKSMPEHQL